MIRNILKKLGLVPSDEERKIAAQLKKPHMKSARVTARGGLTKKFVETEKTIAFRKKCVEILREADKRI